MRSTRTHSGGVAFFGIMRNLQGIMLLLIFRSEGLGFLLLFVPLAVSAKSPFNIFDFVHGPL